MFKDFLTSLLEKITGYLIAHPDLLQTEPSKRGKKLEALKIPTSFKQYLENVSEKEILRDFALIITFIHNSKTAEIKNNDFFKYLLEFFTIELARKIDYLDSDFYLLNKEERHKVIEKLIPGDTNLAESLQNILTNYTYPQLASEIINMGNKVAQAPYIVIQSPREIETELKREIRTQIIEKHPVSFPIFQVNRKLIGGIRIFQDGKIFDHSWLARVLRFTSLTSA